MSGRSNTGGKKKKHKKMSTKKKVLITLSIVALFIFSLVGGGFIYTYSLLDKMDTVELNKDDLGIDSEIENKLSSFEGIKNIALFGIDALEGETGRSDAIMILSIDNTNKTLKVSSIMRDSYVRISNSKMNKMDKINHAYAFGGPELALKTLNENFGLNIEDFVAVDFSSLPEIIDALGGMELDITQDELTCAININSHIRYSNDNMGTSSPLVEKAGRQVVNGVQALSYARIRYTAGGDSERTERQRIVLGKLFEKFKETSPTKYPSLLNQFLPLVKTSLTSNEILGLATDVVSMGNITIEQDRFPRDGYSEDTMIDGVYYLKYDKQDTIDQLHDFIFGDSE